MFRGEKAYRPRSGTPTIFIISALKDFQREIFDEGRAHGLNFHHVHRSDLYLHLLEHIKKGEKNVMWSIIASLWVNANLGCVVCAWDFE